MGKFKTMMYDEDYDFLAELNKMEYEELLHQEMEKEVTTTYQLTETEQNALNKYMEESNAFYTSNGAVPGSSDVFKLHNRKTKRSGLNSTNKKDKTEKEVQNNGQASC